MARTPNYRLAHALALAQWSNSHTARTINNGARTMGYRGIAVDTSRIGRWIRIGEIPRPPIPHILATLLTEHLGQPINTSDLGLTTAWHTMPLGQLLTPAELTALTHRAAEQDTTPEHYLRTIIRLVLYTTSAHRPLNTLASDTELPT
ncbi:hypothetical protein [Streptantibioticus ferralitis]|uniref:Uncharacterized protein n=1 Tax=Streptantibioticus ferralitis TaxID=236510 RepID=A0ABT5Z1M1_9ACTN|nr:hypothetical protein [Streptantibioticus ferralitis]MDF2257658.1 hypothetical protein [Streptantibioticus ferralitis]